MKPLRFIHISKTGGQSISKVAREQARIEWGMFDKQYRPGIKKSGKDDSAASRLQIVHSESSQQIDSDLSPVICKLSSNIPCHILLSNIQHYETINRYDWFMVVRNPYERFVSLYNWYTMRQNKMQNIPQHILTRIIQKKMPQKMLQNKKIGINEYLRNGFEHINVQNTCVGCHFTEQYRYLDPKCHIRVLRYENLEEEFNQLMKEYKYRIILNTKQNVSIKTASLADLTLETIETINKIYEKDFTTFHYEMRHSVFEKEESKNKDIFEQIVVTPSLI